MKIAIIGAGAMGCLYGGKLSAMEGNQVYLLDVWKEHVEAINRCGLSIEENGEDVIYNRAAAATEASIAGIVDLAIVFVKSTLTGQAVKTNQAVFGPDTTILTLQNGLGNIELISEVTGAGNVIAGTTAHGATMLGAGKIRHAGKGKTVIGELDGRQSDRIKAIAEVLNQADLETIVSDNVMGIIWDKLLVNIGINALTGITKLPNGKLLEYPEIETILELAVKEAEAIAKAKGISLSYTDPVAHTKEVCEATAQNKSSMLQDILNHKQTEIDMINAAIVREGATLNIPTPVNMVLTNLIRFFEKQENKNGF